MSSQSASLYVGDLSPEVTEGVLFELFREVGAVLSIKVCRDNSTRKSLGYAYVNFQNPLDAEKAIETMNFCKIKDQPCRIMWVRRDPALRKTGNGNIFIKNLAPNIDNKAIHDTFSAFGKILSCKVEFDEDGKSLGYGYVHYEDEKMAEEATEKVNGMMLNGHQVYVGKFEKKEHKMKELDKQFTNCYVKFLNKSLTDDEAMAFFEKHGKVQSLKLVRDDNGESKGFAYVDFANHEDAANFVNNCNGTEPEGIVEEGFRLHCSRHQRKSERDHLKRQMMNTKNAEFMKHTNLYVKNLDDAVTSEILKDLFEPYGKLVSARVMYDVENKVSKGFGFVCFETHEAATKAAEAMNGRMFHNKPLYITVAQRKDERAAQLDNLYRGGPGAPMGGPGMGGGMPGMGGGMGMGMGGGMGGNMGGRMGMGGSMPGMGMGLGPTGGRPPMGMGGMGGMGGMEGAHMRQGMGMQKPPMGGMGGMGMGMGGGMGGGMPGMGMGMGLLGGGQMGMQGMQQNQMFQQQRQPEAFDRRPPQHAPAPSPMGVDLSKLTNMNPAQQKNFLGEMLFSKVKSSVDDTGMSAKVTGMLLEMDNGEIINLLESQELLKSKINEAIQVLHNHGPK